MIPDFLNFFRCKMTSHTVDKTDFLFEMIVRYIFPDYRFSNIGIVFHLLAEIN